MKHLCTLHAGNLSERETRLCFFSTPAQQPSNAEDAGRRLSQGAENFFGEMAGRFREIIGTDEQTQANLESERNWVAAFNHPEIQTDQRFRLDTNSSFRPIQLLLDMKPEERDIEFVRFMRQMVPGDIRAQYPDVFAEPAFNEFPNEANTLDDFVRTREGKPIEITEEQRNIMLAIQKMLIGENVRDATPNIRSNAETISRAVLFRRYGENANSLEVGVADYEDVLKQFGENPDPNIVENAAVLVEQIEIKSIAAGRFKAALRLGIIDNSALKQRFGPHVRARQEERQAAGHEAALGRNEIDRNVRERARRRNRTLTENFQNMSGKEKFFAVAITSFITYKILTGRSKLLKMIPLGIAGAYFYRRLVIGDTQPLNTMGKFTQDFIGFAGRPIRRGLERVGVVAPESETNALSIMSGFLDEHELDKNPSAQAFAALANVQLGTIASSLSIDRTTGKVTLQTGRGTDLNKEIGAVARRYNLDRRLILQALGMSEKEMEESGLLKEIDENKKNKNIENNKEVSEAMAHVMYLLGAKERGSIAASLESARESYRAQGYVIRSFEDFKNVPGGLKHFNEYINLVMLGRDKATRQYGDRNFIEIIQEFESETPEAVAPTIDRADVVRSPLEDGKRTEERNLYAETRTATPALRARSSITENGGLLDKEVIESLSNMRRLGLIDRGAEGLLRTKFETIRKEEGTPLRDILIGIEKLKYAILVGSLEASDLPLTRDKVDAITKGATKSTILGSITSFFNRAVGISSHFGEIETLNNVDAILTERLSSGVRSADETGFGDMRDRIGAYRSMFQRLRSTEKLNPTLISEVEGVLGDDSEAFLESLYEDPNKPFPSKGQRIDAMEKYLAQRMANSIALAMLTEHRANGNHTLITEADDRLISPQEEENLLREFDQIFAEVIDQRVIDQRERTPGSEGMWEMVDILDTNIDFNKLPESIPGLEDEDSETFTYDEALENLRKIGQAWFIIKDSDPAKARVLATRMDAIQKLITEHVEDLESRDIKLLPASPGNSGLGFKLVNLMIQLAKLRGKNVTVLSAYLFDGGTPNDGTQAPNANPGVPNTNPGQPNAGAPLPNTNPGQPNTNPGQPNAGAPVPNTNPGQPNTNPGQPNAGAPVPNTNPGQPNTGAPVPNTNPGQPNTNPGQPNAGAPLPNTNPGQPNTNPGQPNPNAPQPNPGAPVPNTGPGQPNTNPGQPNAGAPIPNTNPGQPNTGAPVPNTNPGQPNGQPGQPNTNPGQPNAGAPVPNTGPGQPNTNPGQPNAGAPVPNTGPGQPNTNPGQPNPNAPQPNPGAPVPNTGPGQPNTNPGQPNAGAPIPNTNPGQPNTGAPVPNTNPGQPNGQPGQPNTNPGQPNAGAPVPNTGPGQPNTNPGQPNAGAPVPNTGPGQPNTNPGQPNAGAPVPNTGPGQPNTNAPQPNPGAPVPNTGPGQPNPNPGQPNAGAPVPNAPETAPLPEVIDIPSLVRQLQTAQNRLGTNPRIEFRVGNTPGHIEFAPDLRVVNVMPNAIASVPAALMQGKTAQEIRDAYFAWMNAGGAGSGNSPF